MSKVIRETETKMRMKGLSLPAEFEGLEWRTHGKHMRICLGTKPFIEHSAEVRSEHFEKLPKLLKAADKAMAEKYGHVRDSQIGI